MSKKDQEKDNEKFSNENDYGLSRREFEKILSQETAEANRRLHEGY